MCKTFNDVSLLLTCPSRFNLTQTKKFAVKSVEDSFHSFDSSATTHVRGWWKRSSTFLKQNARQRRSTVLYNSNFFRLTRPTWYLWRWSVRIRWKDSTFFIIGCVLQRRWANALPVFTEDNGCAVLFAEQVVMKTRNDFQMAWYQRRTWGEAALFMIFDSQSDLLTRIGVADKMMRL